MRLSLGRLLLTILTVIMILALVARPRIAFEGALIGMDTWWNIVFPALLPFFIVSELVLTLGLAGFIGVLLEPVMRPIFRLPGSASLAMAVGYSSGYPVGANFTARLRSEGMCTRAEAEHLLSFTNNASPLFILVAISVGMFHNPALGTFILAVHYLSNLALGLLFRHYYRQERTNSPIAPNLWKRAYHKYLAANSSHPGRILGEAVKTAVAKLLVIGGFIVLFAVAIQLMNSYGLLTAFASLLGYLLQSLGLMSDLYPALATGFFEMTLGIRLVTETAAPLVQQLVAIQLILAWSGLSIQAQVASFVAGTDIRLRLYFLGRLAHAALAAFLTFLLFPAFENRLVVSTINNPLPGPDWGWMSIFQTSIFLALILPLAVLSSAMFIHLLRRLFHVL